MLEVIHHKDRIQVNLPAITCLLSSQGMVVLDKLLEVAEQIAKADVPEKYVSLVLQGSATDRNMLWYDDLNRHLLLAETFSRIMKFRWLLSLIRKSQVPWIFLSADHCLGSTWELALACHRRYWFSEVSQVGFPNIAVGGFPSGGTVEVLAKTNPKFKEFWQASPTVSSRLAFQNNYITFCSVVGDTWRQDYPDLLGLEPFTDHLISSSSVKTRTFTRSDISETFGDEAKEVVADQLDAMRSRVKTEGAPSGAIWEYCWGLIKQRNKFKDSRELGRLIALMSARFYHSRNYQSFIYANCIKFQAENLPNKAGEPIVRLMIDLNFLIPPTKLLTSILNAGVHVIFVSTESKTLMSALNMVFNRLERMIGADSARFLWKKQVAWFSGFADSRKAPVLRWTVDDRIMIVTNEGTFEYLRLEGNSSQSGKGIMEALNQMSLNISENKQLAWIIPLIADGLYDNPLKNSNLPLSIYVRSSFFQEALRISKHSGKDISNILQSLKQQGWLFAGDEESWDRFLGSRVAIYDFESSYQNLNFVSLSQSEWGIGNLKHARTVSKRSDDKMNEKWSPTQISQHLATYLGLLALHLSKSSTNQKLDVVDHIAGVAVGFPIGMGTPVGYLLERGSRRVSDYCHKHWPELSIDSILQDIKRPHDVLR
jgi:hypothetical protein